MNALEFIIKIRDLAKGKLDEIASSLKSTKKGFEGASQSANEFEQKAKSLSQNTLSNLRNGLIALVSVGALTGMLSGIVGVTAEYEKYNAVLTNTFQSAEKSGIALAGLDEFAKKTPFALNDITDSYVKLVNRGIVPTKKELTAFGDIASSQGKSINQLVEAILDAQTGEFERLKEFGIKASKEGDKVALTFKGQTQKIDMTADAMRKYFETIGGGQGVVGSMAAESMTLGGQISNLGDSVDTLKRNMGQGLSPVLTKVVGMMGSFVGFLNDNLDVVGPLALGIGTLGLALAGYSVYQFIAAKAANSLTRAIWAQNMALLANPLFWIPAAIAAVAAGFFILYKRSETFRKIIGAIGGAFTAAWTNFKAWISGMWEGIKNIAAGAWQIIQAIATPLVNLVKGIANIYISVFGFLYEKLKAFAEFVWGYIGPAVTIIWKQFSWMIEKIGGAFNWIWDTVSSVFTSIYNFASDIFGKLIDNLIGAFSRFADWLKTGVGWILEKIGVDMDKVASGVDKMNKGASQVKGANDKYAEKVRQGAQSGMAKEAEKYRNERKKDNKGGLFDSLANGGQGGASAAPVAGNSAMKSSQSSGGSSSSSSGSSNVSISLQNLVGTLNITVADISELRGTLEDEVLDILSRVLNKSQISVQ